MILTATSVILVISALLLVWVKSIMSSIKILALQSLFLGIACLALGAQTGSAELYVMAVLTILVKAILIPFILAATMRKINIRREAEKYIGRGVSLLLASGLVVFNYVVTERLDLILLVAEIQTLPHAVSMLLIGLFVMVTHKKAIMQGIGLIVIENGLFLLALSTALGMPFFVEIGIFLDVLVSVILISILSYRMDQTFRSISTDWLRKLKG
jgi:hydrogenase-4 component E